MRTIEPEMVMWLDGKLSQNSLAIEAIQKRDVRLLITLAAQCCVGIKEHGGNNSGPLVELIQKTVGGAVKEPWCMSFVQTCIAYAEAKTMLRSPFWTSEHVLTCWENTNHLLRVKRIPLAGAIAIWRHDGTSNGHCGVVESCDGEIFYCYEGNTESGLNKQNKVVRDGGGVYRTMRSVDGQGSMRLMGWIKPF